MVSSDSWETAALGALVTKVEAARDDGKYLFLWDKNGSVSMFFKYKGHLCDWAPEQVKYSMAGATDKSPVLDCARKSIVHTMRSGDNMLLDFDKMTPDLNEWKDDAIFDANKVFDRTEWLKKDNYIKYVKENENHGIGGLNPGHYLASENWTLTVRTSLESEDDVNAFIATLPHKENFKFLIIE